MSDPLEMSQQASAPPPTPHRTGRAIKVALAVSLALNLLVAGMVGGAFLGGHRGDAPQALRALGLGPFALALSREDRAAVRGGFQERATGDDRPAIGAGLVAVQAALRSDPFDRAAAAAALSRSRAAAGALQAHGHDALLDHLARMDGEARADLADRLDRVLRRAGRQGSQR